MKTVNNSVKAKPTAQPSAQLQRKQDIPSKQTAKASIPQKPQSAPQSKTQAPSQRKPAPPPAKINDYHSDSSESDEEEVSTVPSWSERLRTKPLIAQQAATPAPAEPVATVPSQQPETTSDAASTSIATPAQAESTTTAPKPTSATSSPVLKPSSPSLHPPAAQQQKKTINYEDIGSNTLNHALLSYNMDAIVNILPRGLNNVKNSCYMNAAMQALLFTPPFFNLINALVPLELDKKRYPLTKKMVQYVKEFRRASAKDIETSGAAFTPEYLLSYFRQIENKTFLRGQQHDVQEFLNYVLEKLHEELKKKGSYSTSSSFSEDDGWNEVVGSKTVKVQEIKFEESPISAIFQGRMRSLLKKRYVKGSLTVQPFYSLHLPVGERIHSIKESLQLLTSKEEVEDISAQKQIAIEQLPKVLLLHLERFAFDERTLESVKLTQRVSYDMNLYIEEDVLPTTKLPLDDHKRYYELSGVICHHGYQASGGHYSSYVRLGADKWIHIDDNRITQVSPQSALEQQAYMLFYVQHNPDKYRKYLSQQKPKTEPKEAATKETKAAPAKSTKQEPKKQSPKPKPGK